MAKKDSELPAATTVGMSGTAYWVIVDKLGASVKATFAQFATAIGGISSIIGDVSAVMVDGIATTAIGALKVVTGMIAASAVTYAKMQNISATNRLLGRWNSGAGVVEELNFSGSQLSVESGTLTMNPNTLKWVAPAFLSSDYAVATTTLSSVTGLTIAVAANTNYFFEFYLIYDVGALRPAPRFSVSTPASFTKLDFMVRYGRCGHSTNSGDENTERASTSDGGVGTTQQPDNASEIHHGSIVGVFRNGANAGNIQLRVCGTSSANSWTVKKGSMGRAFVLG